MADDRNSNAGANEPLQSDHGGSYQKPPRKLGIIPATAKACPFYFVYFATDRAAT
jgi:hypothetical protein